MSGFQLSTQSAQRIVAEIGGIVGQNINMMDAQGYICLLYTSRCV